MSGVLVGDLAEPPAADARGETRSAQSTVRVFLENRLAVVGLAIIVAFVLFCWVGPLLYHTSQVATSLGSANEGPSPRHLLGTDSVGYDELGRLMVGGQTSLEIGFIAALLATTFGAVWGAVSGYMGGVADAVMMRIVDTALAVPSIFLLLFIASIVTPSVPLLVFVIASLSWLTPSRLVRAETLSLRGREYVQAARLSGGGHVRLILRHIIPNTIGTIAVNATFQVSDAIIAVASLSFLGLGIPPPSTNWGAMLSNGVNYVFQGYWWQLWPPGLCIVLIVVAFNLCGDATRDALEVRLRQR